MLVSDYARGVEGRGAPQSPPWGALGLDEERDLPGTTRCDVSEQFKISHRDHPVINRLTHSSRRRGREYRTKYEYDSLGQVKRGAKFFNDGYPVPGLQFEYAHDDIGNRKTTRAGGDENGGNLRVASYTVNSLNQYSQRDVPGAFDVIGLAMGNNSTLQINSTMPWRKGEYFRKELSSANGSVPKWESVSVTATGETAVNGYVFVPKTPEAFTYDLDGNLTQDGRWDYTWDAENRVVKMESRTGAPTGSKRRLELAYDGKARRIWKKVTNLDTSTVLSEEKFVYDGWNLITKLNTSSAVLQAFTWGLDLSGTLQGAGGVGGLLEVNDAANGVHFCAYDGNGNVASLVKGTDGTVSASYEYGPFGESLRLNGVIGKANPFRFSTKFQDDESDFLYYGYRSYNPSMGRWLSRDPIGEKGGKNLYGFVLNRPNQHVDHLGRFLFDPSGELACAASIYLATCCMDLCQLGQVRIDKIDVAIIPAAFNSPEGVENAEDFVGALEALHLCPIVPEMSAAATLGAAVEQAYAHSAGSLHNAFETALGAFSGDRAFVKLFTRVHFSKCYRKSCMIFWKRNEYDSSPSSPTGWKEFTDGISPGLDAYLGLQDAESHIVEASERHGEEVEND